MSRTLPPGRATDVIAAVTALAFLIVELGGLTNQAAVYAGFIAGRIDALSAQGVDVDIAWLPLWLTPLSATLVHGGWLHIGSNLLAFVFCGRQVEHVLGPLRLSIIYVVGAYVAAAAQWAANPLSLDPMIGASGAISAVLGTYALIYSQREVRAIGPVPAQIVRMLWLAAGWTVLQLMIGVVGFSIGPFGGIAIWAHIGGFMAGLLLARPMLSWRFGTRMV
jgi:membrane associated rhomboid family serine protease